MLRRAHHDQRGITSSDYAGILVVVSLVFLALFALNLDEKVAPAVEKAVCQILGGESCDQQVAGEPEKCLVGQSTTSANANVFVAFVQVDKDSILIREDFSDGSSKFTIVDNTEAAGELFAGAKAKVGKLGADLSAEALAGVGLAGGRVFEFDNQDDADAFQDTVQAAGGFDGILRDLASYDDEIPILGWDNPVGGVNDWALDQLGIDDNGDLPKPTETYVEGKAFLNGSGKAGAGVGVLDGELKALIEGAGVVKVTSSGKNEGDVEFTVQLDADASGDLTVGTLGGGLNGQLGFTATISLDAQNGYKPDKLVAQGQRRLHGLARHEPAARGRRAQGHLERARGGLAVLQRRRRPGPGGLGRARPDRPGQPRRRRCRRSPARARTWSRSRSRSTRTASSASTPTTSPAPRPRARSRSASASAAAVAAARAARPRATAAAWCACPGGTFEPRICKQPS